MKFFESFSQSQIAGIILQLAILPFLFISFRRLWWAKQSEHWPKVKGFVKKGLDFPLSKVIDFLYTYEINGIEYKGKNPFFANSFKNFKSKKAAELMDNYPKDKQVAVFYHPSNPAISTLEPGRKDGVVGALVLLLLLFLLGYITYSYPALITDILDYFHSLSIIP